MNPFSEIKKRMSGSTSISTSASTLDIDQTMTMEKMEEARKLMEMNTKIHPPMIKPKERTAMEMVEMTKSLDQNNLSPHLDMSEYTKKMMEEVNKSLQNNGSLVSPPNSSPDMNDIVQRIRLDRNKVLQQGMQPKHLYLGHKQMVALRETKLPDINYVATDRVTYIMYEGFDVFEVDQENHYVMTGE